MEKDVEITVKMLVTVRSDLTNQRITRYATDELNRLLKQDTGTRRILGRFKALKIINVKKFKIL